MFKPASRGRSARPSLLDGIGRAAEHAVTDHLLPTLERLVDELLHRAFSRSLAYIGAGTLLVAGAVLVLYGAVEGLLSVKVPPAPAFALIGVASFGAGHLLIRGLGKTRRE